MPTYLKEYTPPPFLLDSVELRFELDEQATRVQATGRYRRNPATEAEAVLRLDGEALELLALRLDGRALEPGDYTADDTGLTLHRAPDAFTLEVETRIDPAANTALEGLYLSGGNLCTQCEAEGFRKITYFPDRPDVMAVYTTTLVADKARYPVLLANGNPVEQGELDDGRHYATWHDPFPKPSYLFALVAGDLAHVEDHFTTASERDVTLRIYVRAHDLEKCGHAMASLKEAMAWDERRYGREYDLEVYNIVAVSDFNMGAMENKGLNIFNSRYVLADAESATDNDFVHIEGVIAHEYFHNWSGNRVTCRDWFQLSLKEGFTVFRDQQFSAEMSSSAVKRIDDVCLLRTHQFQEDAGPMAHPVRPAAYEEINNFYTLTVYNKGAEVVRMLHTLLGEETFRRGCDLYFERHDGRAVTTDDFVQAMADASGRDLTRFKRWYDQAGTPVLTVEREYDAETQTYTLTVGQSCPPTPDQAEKQPFHIPLRLGLLDAEGEALPLQLEGEAQAAGSERVLELTETEQRFTFVNVPPEPVPSLLRGFSAPVRLELDLDDQELAFLMAHDGDPFNRWDAGQQLAVRVMLRLLDVLRTDGRPELDENLASAFGQTLAETRLPHALIAEALSLPAEAYVGEFLEEVDPQAVHVVRQFLRRNLAFRHREALIDLYDRLTDDGPYRVDAEAVGRRRLRNLCMAYLVELGNDEVRNLAANQFQLGQSMTDVVAALTALVHTGAPEQHQALETFYQRFVDDELVIDKWFAIQAGAPLPGAVEQMERLAAHPAFTLKNPNRVRALYGTFAAHNRVGFHAVDGSGYRFLGSAVLALDQSNPQVAARLVTPLSQWRRYEPQRSGKMRAELERIAGAARSRDVGEIVGKSLAP